MQKTETLGRLRCGLRSLNPIAGLLFEEGLGLSLGSRDLGGYFNCLSLEAENLSARSQKVWQGRWRRGEDQNVTNTLTSCGGGRYPRFIAQIPSAGTAVVPIGYGAQMAIVPVAVQLPE